MEFIMVNKDQWAEIKKIYLEAFPKRERKPFFSLRHSVKRGKGQIFTASENDTLMGFIMVIPYQNMVMVDYLAVSGAIRSRGTGSRMLQEICRHFSDKKIVLLIERLDEHAENSEQRFSRRKFYFKNGFTSSNIFIKGKSGDMEILNFGGKVSQKEYLDLQEYALGKLFFRLSNITITA